MQASQICNLAEALEKQDLHINITLVEMGVQSTLKYVPLRNDTVQGIFLKLKRFLLTAIGNIAYAYKTRTNQLASVHDNAASITADKLGDFNNGPGGDYGYDANGNITSDPNKGITSVTYNSTVLPATVITAGRTVEYMYDTTGSQLQRKGTEGTKVTTTSFVGLGVYETVHNGSAQIDETLQYFGMEEGRVKISSSGGTAHFAYDYFIADHLGNTRMVLTDDYDVSSPILEASGYYPFGLKMAVLGYKSALGIAKMYDTEISAATLWSITYKLIPLVTEWQARPLEPLYCIEWLYAMYYKVNDGGKYITRCVYNILGINPEGYKDVLGCYTSESEGANFWLSVLTDLHNRGVRDILIACIDNLKGFSEAITSVFPQTEVQSCIVHQIRNFLKYVASKNQKELPVNQKKKNLH